MHDDATQRIRSEEPVETALQELLAPGAALADTPRSFDRFESRDHRFELRLATPRKPPIQSCSMIEVGTGRSFYHDEDRFDSQYVVVSDDGRGCAVLAYFPLERPAADTVVREFYGDGRFVANYAFGQLVNDVKFIRPTVSHRRWFTTHLDGSHEDDLVDRDGHLILTTFDLTTHLFDLRTGQRVGQRCYAGLPAGVSAYSGIVRALAPPIDEPNRRLVIKSGCALCGSGRQRQAVEFELPADLAEPLFHEWLANRYILPNTEGEATVLLRDGRLIGVWRAFISEACR